MHLYTQTHTQTYLDVDTQGLSGCSKGIRKVGRQQVQSWGPQNVDRALGKCFGIRKAPWHFLRAAKEISHYGTFQDVMDSVLSNSFRIRCFCVPGNFIPLLLEIAFSKS